MPARKPDVEIPDDPMRALGERFVRMPPEHVAGWIERLPAADVRIVQRAVAGVAKKGWRANPATFGAHLDPSYQLWPYVVLLGERFRLAADGIEPHQIWELPSQYGKTTALIWGALWLLDRDPTLRIMYLSYDANKAVEEGGKARDLAVRHADELSFRLRRDRRARGAWRTEQGGGFYATGIKGAITGFPQDVLLLDDLIKGWQAAHSETERETAWKVYQSQARLRLQSNRNPIINAGTRWHEDDPAARMMAAAEESPAADQWAVLRLPAVAEAADPKNADPLLREPDPLGRAPGDVLEPERFPPEEVEARRLNLGSYLWAAMEQQRPAPEEGGKIKRVWWKLYTVPPPRFDELCTSWDTKLKDAEGGDFVVGQAWGRTGSDYWCLDQLRGQWDQATTKAAIVLLAVRFPTIRRHVIENTGNGPEVMKALRMPQADYAVSEDVRSQLGMTDAEVTKVNRIFRRGLPGLIPEVVKGSKIARAIAQVPLLEAGNVHVPDGPVGLSIINEAAAFPRGAHDDQVDAWSQAMKRLSVMGGKVGKKPDRRTGKPKPSARATKATGRANIAARTASPRRAPRPGSTPGRRRFLG